MYIISYRNHLRQFGYAFDSIKISNENLEKSRNLVDFLVVSCVKRKLFTRVFAVISLLAFFNQLYFYLSIIK